MGIDDLVTLLLFTADNNKVWSIEMIPWINLKKNIVFMPVT